MNFIAETQRLQIVSFSPDDTRFLYELTSDDDVMKYFPKVLSYEETCLMLEKISDQYEWKVDY